MFGYVLADVAALSEEEITRYKSCYCGLCRTLGHEFGALHRFVLNYDLTFLAMFLSSLYEPETYCHTGRCIVHPFSEQSDWTSEATVYAAAMNVALAYHKNLDDWKDERKFSACVASNALKRSAQAVAKAYPKQWQAIELCMHTLSDLEASDCQEPDLCANVFGALMEELFVWKQDRWESLLRQMGRALGKFIYLMDAVLDLPEDRKHHRYNPLKSRDTDTKEYYQPILTILIGECTDAFEQLPIVQDLHILRNILYSGIWTRYFDTQNKEQNHV